MSSSSSKKKMSAQLDFHMDDPAVLWAGLTVVGIDSPLPFYQLAFQIDMMSGVRFSLISEKNNLPQQTLSEEPRLWEEYKAPSYHGYYAGLDEEHHIQHFIYKNDNQLQFSPKDEKAFAHIRFWWIVKGREQDKHLLEERMLKLLQQHNDIIFSQLFSVKELSHLSFFLSLADS